jgi:hypothetical protein
LAARYSRRLRSTAFGDGFEWNARAASRMSIHE